jgi:nucleotide-binding universal stress UspA family protein
MFRTILHPTDFSDSSQAAFAVACSLAQSHRCRLVIAHVLQTPTTAYLGGELIPAPEEQLKEAWLKLHEVRPDDLLPEVEHRLVLGEAAREIVRLAEELQCDLVVLGTHGRSRLKRLVLGSVAEQVLRTAPCPVLTVKFPHPSSAKEAGRLPQASARSETEVRAAKE